MELRSREDEEIKKRDLEEYLREEKGLRNKQELRGLEERSKSLSEGWREGGRTGRNN